MTTEYFLGMLYASSLVIDFAFESPIPSVVGK